MTATLYDGDCLEILRTLEAWSVQTCVTSPPYYGLRDYGTATWEGGDAGCDHKPVSDNTKQALTSTQGGSKRNVGNALTGYGQVCAKCGAVRMDAQIGLEQTPEQYIERLVAVFREVRRVLADDGTLWVNIGDSYNANQGIGFKPDGGRQVAAPDGWKPPKIQGVKPKDLLGIPWMLAFALRADGWYLRSEIIWHKPNPMPESVTDRPTKAHEQIFLLSKSPNYFYDSAAIAELSVDAEATENYDSSYENASNARRGQAISGERKGQEEQGRLFALGGGESVQREVEEVRGGSAVCDSLQEVRQEKSGFETALRKRQGKGDNQAVSRDPQGTGESFAWGTQATGEYEPGAMRLDGNAMAGDQGSPSQQMRDLWGDETADKGSYNSVVEGRSTHSGEYSGSLSELQQPEERQLNTRNRRDVWTVATQPYPEAHFATFPPALIEPCILAGSRPGDTVLDPFSGSGTTGSVAVKWHRDYIGIDLSAKYNELARRRLAKTQLTLIGA